MGFSLFLIYVVLAHVASGEASPNSRSPQSLFVTTSIYPHSATYLNKGDRLVSMSSEQKQLELRWGMTISKGQRDAF